MEEKKENVPIPSIYFTYINILENTVLDNQMYSNELNYLKYYFYGINNKYPLQVLKLKKQVEFNILFDFFLFDYKKNNYGYIDDVLDIIQNFITVTHVPYIRKWALENIYSLFKIENINIMRNEILITDVLHNNKYYISTYFLSRFILKENQYYFGRILPGENGYEFYIHHDVNFNNIDNINEKTAFINILNNIINTTYTKKLNPMLVHFVFVEKKDIPILLKYQHITFPDIEGKKITDPISKAVFVYLYQFILNQMPNADIHTLQTKAIELINTPIDILDNKTPMELITLQK